MGKEKRQKKKHIIPYDTVFRPDPFGDKEDIRPIEIRKKRKPDKSFIWGVNYNGK